MYVSFCSNLHISVKINGVKCQGDMQYCDCQKAQPLVKVNGTTWPRFYRFYWFFHSYQCSTFTL